jgi:hypothetical protein
MKGTKFGKITDKFMLFVSRSIRSEGTASLRKAVAYNIIIANPGGSQEKERGIYICECAAEKRRNGKACGLPDTFAADQLRDRNKPGTWCNRLHCKLEQAQRKRDLSLKTDVWNVN